MKLRTDPDVGPRGEPPAPTVTGQVPRVGGASSPADEEPPGSGVAFAWLWRRPFQQRVIREGLREGAVSPDFRVLRWAEIRPARFLEMPQSKYVCALGAAICGIFFWVAMGRRVIGRGVADLLRGLPPYSVDPDLAWQAIEHVRLESDEHDD